ncbi:hypothetical protein QTP88_022030 [Uroleucon formosanum]
MGSLKSPVTASYHRSRLIHAGGRRHGTNGFRLRSGFESLVFVFSFLRFVVVDGRGGCVVYYSRLLPLLVDENLKKWLDLVVYPSNWVGFKIVISSWGRKDRVFNDSGQTRYSAYADVLDGFNAVPLRGAYKWCP